MRSLTYKALQAGVKIVIVDPRDTSRTCLSCGHIDKKNRKSQSEFECVLCGFKAHADVVGAKNISSRAAVNRPRVSVSNSVRGGGHQGQVLGRKTVAKSPGLQAGDGLRGCTAYAAGGRPQPLPLNFVKTSGESQGMGEECPPPVKCVIRLARPMPIAQARECQPTCFARTVSSPA